MNKQEYETLRNAAAESHAKYLHAALDVHPAYLANTVKDFNAGSDWVYDLMQKRVEELEAKLAICKTALEYSWAGSYGKDVVAFNKHTLEKLAQLEGKAE